MRVISRFHDAEGNVTYFRADGEAGNAMVDQFTPGGRDIVFQGSLEAGVAFYLEAGAAEFMEERWAERLNEFMVENDLFAPPAPPAAPVAEPVAEPVADEE